MIRSYRTWCCLLALCMLSACVPIRLERNEIQPNCAEASSTAVVRGQVVDYSGNPLFDVLVELRAGRHKKPICTGTDLQGKFEIHGLEAGEYSISFESNGRKESLSSVRVSAASCMTLKFAVYFRGVAEQRGWGSPPLIDMRSTS